MKKLLFKFIKYAVLAVVLSVMVTTIVLQQRNIKSLKNQTKEQSEVILEQRGTIKELLQKETFRFDVALNVRDQSKMTVNGKGNSGTINVPTTRTYELKIDSSSFIQFNPSLRIP
ncbi:MAG: hypothetical protein FWC34_09005 [Bacteroidetes bacterium]|nr:hypothetical protein [Bacteroidota bacterium]